MIFLMGKSYWEFLTNDEQEPIFLKNCTPQQIQAKQILAWKRKRNLVLVFPECFGFHDCACIGCKITQANLEHVDENP